MSKRAMAVLVPLLFVLIPRLATGQPPKPPDLSPDTRQEGRERLSLQVAAGPTVIDAGHVLAAAFGYSPASRVELLVNVERNHLPFRLERFDGIDSATRGGTMTFVSGELRVALMPADRVSPFAVAGAGAGISRPTVNDTFPDAITNRLRVLYAGGGVRIPLRRGFTLWGDARATLALESNDGVLAVWPVRAGLAWRF